MGKAAKKFLIAGVGMAAVWGMMKVAAKRLAEDGAIDDDSPYLQGGSARGEGSGRQVREAEASTYESRIKPMLDQILSFGGLIALAPFYGAIALAIKIDDPGPAIFTQKRVGRDKRFFYCHKFRTMKMCTPHDVPTHQLQNPEQYITRVGRLLRKYSLDELPQLLDIFTWNMSVIGPRPALWNQEDLIAERDKYGANDVLPGLTGWAQINGRDELEIAEKARLDGEYVRKLRQGGLKALFFDAECFGRTIFSVIGSRGVVEGGTGRLHRLKGKVRRPGSWSASGKCGGLAEFCGRHGAGDLKWKKMGNTTAKDAGFADYGHLKRFDIDLSEKNKKRVLITGAGSYIGESFERWAKEHYPVNFTVDTLDMQDPGWRKHDFSVYDAVFHVAGIAHQREKRKNRHLYYEINRDLAARVAETAKNAGVRQFVLMSTMAVYGMKDGVIRKDTQPRPTSHYGRSKSEADRAIWKMRGETFKVAILRPPMVYGKGCKGNYQRLRQLALVTPVFPNIDNQRSMVYIGNLCEFLCRLMLSGEGGMYFPQNRRYVNTSEMVRLIARAHGKEIRMTSVFNRAVKTVPLNAVKKAFGNLVYEPVDTVEQYNFEESIKLTEESAYE